METELESAGIDPFEFSLMDEDERHEALEDAFLDPWDFEDFDLEYPGGYSYSTPSVTVTPIVPKPPATESSPVIKEPVVIPPKPEKTNTAPVNQAVIRKLPDYPASQEPSKPVSEDALRRQRRRAEIAAIDRKMHQLRNMIIVLLSLLVIIVVAGISTANRSPGVSIPSYTIEPTTIIVPYTTPTPRPTPTPMPSVPYVGMYVSYVPSKWTWQGTDNLTVKDAAGNGIRTIKYRYDAPPKIYVIWVSESTNNVVKVSVTDPTASSNRKSSTNKKSSSDPYQAKDYAHPDDFYYDYYDDFWDYEDAEDYWERAAIG